MKLADKIENYLNESSKEKPVKGATISFTHKGKTMNGVATGDVSYGKYKVKVGNEVMSITLKDMINVANPKEKEEKSDDADDTDDDADVSADYKDGAGLAKGFIEVAKKFDITVKKDEEAEDDEYAFFLTRGDKTAYVSADYKDVAKLGKRFVEAFQKLGVEVEEHPAYKNSDEYGYRVKKKK